VEVFFHSASVLPFGDVSDSGIYAGKKSNPNLRSMDTTEGSTHYTQKDMSTIIEISKQVRPKWDGQPESWKTFWKLWEYYLNLSKDPMEGANPEMKKWMFVRCLPTDEAERARHLIIEGISFEALVNRYHVHNDLLVTCFQAESAWRAFVPVDKRWKGVDFWFSKWTRMAAEIPDLTEGQMKEQFDMVITTLPTRW